MEEVNALKVRNHLGEILDRLNTTGDPILINKGRKLRAVLITPEQFKTRFLDCKAKEEKERLLHDINKLRMKKKDGQETSLDILRGLRGYGNDLGD